MRRLVKILADKHIIKLLFKFLKNIEVEIKESER